ncbi:MAG: ArnT family glycosyltransferase [Acidobacteriaceae bacterium]
MQLIRRFRLPALLCALAVLLCELASRPYAEMGVSDDGPYVLIAQKLAATGHIVYNGWASPLLGWQLYLGATFIKLFGFSFTSLRMSTLLVAVAVAWLLQRTAALAGVNERNAALGTLALVLSPLYLMLAVTYMTDIFGLFAVVACLYGCLRALRTSTDRAAVAWLCFAVACNGVFGTARQIAWLGILVMVPSALYLLGRRGTWRARQRVLLAGGAATLAGALFILACMQWFKRQPYIMPEHLIPPAFPVARTFLKLAELFLDIPFLLLPVAALFLPQIRGAGRRTLALAVVVSVGYALLVLLIPPRPADSTAALLEPIYRNLGDWVGIHGIHEGVRLQGRPPVFLYPWMQGLVTFASLGGLIGLAVCLLPSTRRRVADAGPPTGVTWRELGVLLGPFVLAYTLLLVPRAATFTMFDRYLLELLVAALILATRYYQESISPRLPRTMVLLIAIMAVYGVACTHNMFSLYRARLALAGEVRASGLPDTSVDYGFEYNFGTELRHANHLNVDVIVTPADAYVPAPPLPAGTCDMFWHDYTPHIRPVYGVSFDPNACYGLAPFAPVHYSRWPYRAPGTLYVVRYVPAAKE